ncbi:MAG TPA: glutamine-hydrolyzing carbamoyl-phosphate synthase small subunit [Thermoleophilia bacterium]|nr:glutamine-hydrolyzing carbamoyl-phosphate synthase small subunit [Thermoleophilia bacterium]
MPEPALIVLEDGASFTGEALTGHGMAGGEFVFNTSMSGYQEIVTDPSYAGQVIAFTFPMNGDYGVDPARDESDRAYARAVVARELVNYRYNHASSGSWLEWLADHDVLAVGGVDTRALTRHLRDKGALRGVVSAGGGDVKSLRAAARRLPRMSGLDLASRVTCTARYERPAAGGERFHVVALDLGVKRAMLGYLSAAGMRVTVVPAGTSAREIVKLAPDGVFLSNGPGDPAAVTSVVKTVQRLLGKVPVFGICLGHQLLALALGYSTYKLKFGHRGANHPVKDLRTGVIEITTQNHGFAVRDDGEEHGDATVTHVDLNDGTVEGVAAPGQYAFSVQYHPESSPGPHDSLYLFERFAAEMTRFRERS